MASLSLDPTPPNDEGPEPLSHAPLSGGNVSPAVAEAQRLVVALQGVTTPHAAPGNAPLARLRARLQDARRRRDREAERDAAELLSRELVRRSSELDTAVLLARRALALQDALPLREELVGWLGGQGDHGGAAAELRRGIELCQGSEAVQRWARVGDALARGGDGAGAVDALRAALEHDPDAFVVREVLAAVAFWDPARVRPEVGAALLMEASRERLLGGDEAGALEDRLRAGELVQSLEISESIAELLQAQGKGAAADEVLRQAAARETEGVGALHRRRIQRALEARDVVRAFGAALDGGFEARGGEDGELFDMLLDLTGLQDLLFARIELRAEASAGEARAELYADLGRLLGASPDHLARASMAWRCVLEESPEHEEAREALRALGAPEEPLPPVDEDGLRARLAAGVPAGEMADLRGMLCRAARLRGDRQGALHEALLVLEVLPEQRDALAMTAAIGSLLGLGAAKVEAIVGLTSGFPNELRSSVLTWAARATAAQGDGERAKKFAERASQSDPSSPRAAVALAELWTGGRDRVALMALERVVSSVVPSGALCQELVLTHEALQQHEQALVWAQRRVALRPGDPEALLGMLRLAPSVEAASRIEEVLEWVGALAVPTAPWGAAIGGALEALARVDAQRSAEVSWRLLDALGPFSPEFRDALIQVATLSEDHALAAACLERWLARGASPGERGLGWQQAAHHHDLAKDVYGAARALSRALKDNAAPADISTQISMLTADEPDGSLALMEVRAEALGSATGKAFEVAGLWRDIGAARWGWAGDRAGMVRAWVRAAELEPIQGPARLVRDLFAFTNPTQAVEEMLLHAEQKKSPREASQVLSLASLAAFHAGERKLAFDTAERAVRLDPSRTEALAICEVAADVSHDIGRMEDLYSLLSTSAKGKFGRRAAHYRAARTLEGWGFSEQAARHALVAFEQVPSLGTPYALMTRLAQKASFGREVVETLSRVAAAAPSAHERWTWLMRAAGLCGADADGIRGRADVLLRAVRERPDRKTVEATADALAALGQLGEPECLTRFEEVGRAILKRIDGPDGARVAVSFALASLRVFRSGAVGTRVLRRALEIDADIDEYAEVLPLAQLLAEAELETPEDGLVAACRSLLRQPFANVGVAVLRLCAHTAALERNQEATLDLLLRAAKRFDDDEGLIEEARRALSIFPDEQVATALHKVYEIPPPSVQPPVQPSAPPPPPEPEAPAVDERSLLSIAARDARQTGDLPGLMEALRRLIDIEPEDSARALLQRELALLLTESGDSAGARALWGAILGQNPADRDALVALEQLAVDAGDYDGLVAILGRRCGLASDPDEIRVLRLRRAALLEQRLGRMDDARAELESLLEQQGDDPSATRFLADLLERQGSFIEAGTRWMRAFRLQVDPRDRTELAIRAAQAFVRSGELDQARSALDAALLISRSERLLELRVELERAAGNTRGLAEALDELAIASMASPERRAELLLEASGASLASGDENAALERAQRAARVAPHSAQAQLQARLLEYQARGAGTPQEAAQAIEELRRVSGSVPAALIPLHAFLLAEALDAIHGGNAGMRELSARHAELGAVSFIALGMAERLARASNFQAALPFFEAALASDLLGIRRRGAIALAAAEAAQRLDDLARARTFLGVALQDSSTQAAAQQRLASLDQLAQSRAEQQAADPRRALQELAIRAVGLERARILAQIARLTAPIPGERAEADRLFSEAIAAAYLDPGLRMELENERDALRGVSRSSRPPPAPTARPPSDPALFPREQSTSRPPPNIPPEATRSEPPPSITSRPALSPPPPPPEAPPALTEVSRPGEVVLSELPEPVEEVSPPLSQPSERITLVPGAELEARQRFLLDPSRGEILVALRDAALADHNPPYARALEHVIALFSPDAAPVFPPPLSAQREEPETILRLISRGSTTAAAEALALVWEGASQLFRRDPGSYGITGLDRVALSGNTIACRVYAATARVLGASRTPLFQRRSHGPVAATIALLVPPAVILSGDPREESSELLFRLGYAFLAALPEHALIFGLQEAQLRSLLAALCSAFGPPPEGPVPSANITALAGSLWQTLPARGQRRLKELCANPAEFSLERAGAAARRISQRAGLFLCGDLGVALREVAAEQLAADGPITSFASLAIACERHSAILDLLALAISPEFADMRWRGDRVKRSPSGTFRLT